MLGTPKSCSLNSFGASVCRILSYHSRNDHSPVPPWHLTGHNLSSTRHLCHLHRPGWEGSGHLPIFHPQSITFSLAPGILSVAPAQEQMQSKRWKLLQSAGTGDSQMPPVALWFTPVGSGHSFSHNIMAEMKGEVPVNSHLKVTWILYSQAIYAFPFSHSMFPSF